LASYRWLAALLCIGLASCGDGSDSGFVCPEVSSPPPDVSGSWTYIADTVDSSSCAASVNELVLDTIGGACQVTITQSGADITVRDCRRKTTTGCVDENGNISYTETIQRSFGSCSFIGSSLFTGDELGDPPSSGAIKTPLTFNGSDCGVLTSCTVILTAGWTKQN
jgi:hypothetical protein